MRDLDRGGRLEEAAQKAGVSDKLDLRQLDVTELRLHPRRHRRIVRDHGRIDVLVNNAGFSVAGFGEDLSTSANIRLQFETNFFATVAMSKAVLPSDAPPEVWTYYPGRFRRGPRRHPVAQRLLQLPSTLLKASANRYALKPTRSVSGWCWSNPVPLILTFGRATSPSPRARSTLTRPTRNAVSASPNW